MAEHSPGVEDQMRQGGQERKQNCEERIDSKPVRGVDGGKFRHVERLYPSAWSRVWDTPYGVPFLVGIVEVGDQFL